MQNWRGKKQTLKLKGANQRQDVEKMYAKLFKCIKTNPEFKEIPLESSHDSNCGRKADRRNM